MFKCVCIPGGGGAGVTKSPKITSIQRHATIFQVQIGMTSSCVCYFYIDSPYELSLGIRAICTQFFFTGLFLNEDVCFIFFYFLISPPPPLKMVTNNSKPIGEFI